MSHKKRSSLAGPVDAMARNIVFGHGTRGPALRSTGLNKIVEDYIHAGIRGTDLIQRVINSSGADPGWIRDFLKKHYAGEIHEK